MNKKYMAITAGIAAAIAVAAPAASAAELPALPPIPGIESNGGECSFEPGTGSAESNVPAFTPPAMPAAPDSNAHNCESFLNDMGNGMHSGEQVVLP